MSEDNRQAQAWLDTQLASGQIDEAMHTLLSAKLGSQSGQRNVEAETIGGSVATGDNARQTTAQTYIEQQHNHPPPPDATLPARERYLERLHQLCNVLPLAAIGGDETASDEVQLDEVYIALDTTTRVPLSEAEKAARKRETRSSPFQEREDEDRPLTALEAVTQNKCLLLLGDPGSGKSTFARQLVAHMVDVYLERADAPPGWQTTLLPLFTVLQEIAPKLAQVELTGCSAQQARKRLCNVMREQWRSQLALVGAEPFADKLDDIVASGEVLLVFDGLDEVAEPLRERVRQLIDALLSSYPQLHQGRFLVTCRVRSYHEGMLPGFGVHRLAPFSEEQLQGFIRGWYNAQTRLGRLNGEQATERAADLQRAAAGESLRELATNPMLLTTMAIIHQREVGLPKERVRLYKQAVEVLLRRWQRSKGEDTLSPALRTLLQDDLEMRRILEQIAYLAHQRQASADQDAAQQQMLRRGELLELLEQPGFLGDAALSAEFLEYIDQRAGLLVGQGGTETGRKPPLYSFPHRTFQEYLAGCQMLRGRNRGREFRARAQEKEFWSVAAQLGAEELYYSRTKDAIEVLDLAYALCPSTRPQSEGEWRAVLWSGQMAALLGRTEVEQDIESPEGGDVYLQRLCKGLLQLLRASPLGPIERSDAGRLLAHLGDPRPAVLTLAAIEFCPVPAAPFVLGSGDDDDMARDAEEPQHVVDIDYTYYMARFPVTNAQFQEFVRMGGYAEPHFWPEAAQKGYWQDGTIEVFNDDEPRDAPYNYGEPFTLPNHPVVGVSWYEALAFTRWLTERAHDQQWLAKNWVVRLPIEAEWEKAGRGGEQIPVEVGTIALAQLRDAPSEVVQQDNPHNKRRFPWGNDPNPNRANYGATEIGTTSAVGCFARGASPYGVEELSGNVLEWCLTKWQNNYSEYVQQVDHTPSADDDARVLRGGAFDFYVNYVRCAARYWNDPLSRYSNIGFRVVASPSTSDL